MTLNSYFSLLKCLLYLCSILLLGCGKNNQLSRDYDTYQQRLANVLDASVPDAPQVHSTAFPSPSELRINNEQLSIKLTEFYALRDCSVGTLIAERNTALGKIQLPSQRYVYEVKLLQGLKDCSQRHKDKELNEKLAQWTAHKNRSLPLAWANLVQNSEEMKHALSLSKGFISTHEGDNFAAFLQALRAIVNLKQAPSSLSEKIEGDLRLIKTSPVLAKMWKTQNYLAMRLHQSNLWLEEHLRGLSCDHPSKQKQIKHLENIFTRYFVEQIQVVGAKLIDYNYKLKPVLDKLENDPHLDATFKQFIKSNRSNFIIYQQKMTEHIDVWKTVFSRCQ